MVDLVVILIELALAAMLFATADTLGLSEPFGFWLCGAIGLALLADVLLQFWPFVRFLWRFGLDWDYGRVLGESAKTKRSPLGQRRTLGNLPERVAVWMRRTAR